ncbi:8-amino-7-oxononanoate synthase [Hypericibacter terrae]|uniref:8-amino-7-oxononanoate synthase n=1 Tax=Hypericibacter terrae TaxID=2602015 RepID=A0A5J6MKL7_9PROT|nr:aminotransferase class I/II-fold pyridoxal phosphate-dependent enzyme [Hypericibacter terrae]QEX17075.1 8-amino-7-oxononanoate synthase [Hypericibacter terrae]
MGLFDRFASIEQAHTDVKARVDDPFGVRMDRMLSATEAVIGNRPTILVGTNNYLGLTFDPACVEAAHKALDAYGTGTTGSRIANGSYAPHRDLETELADFYGRRHCMVFTTGYQANLGIISTLAGPQDFLLIDADSHASIYDACRLGTATVVRFKHNDAEDLDKRLRRLADEPGNKVVVTEGIYSMLGDQAPLKEMAEVKRKHGAWMVLDEAHSMGVLGATGRGLAEEQGVEADMDFIVGTFSKSLGAVGGFCVSDHPQFDLLRIVCRPYMFTASLPPSVVASATEALRQIRKRPELRTQLWENVATLYNGFARHGFSLGPQMGPVVAIKLPSPDLAVGFWRALLDRGIYVNLALPPATPQGTALLRCSVCAAHTRAQLDKVVAVTAAIGREFGVIGAADLRAAG